jgi:hypothetical protein
MFCECSVRYLYSVHIFSSLLFSSFIFIASILLSSFIIFRPQPFFFFFSFAAHYLGSCVICLLPIVTENCAEVTYPISEDISVGVLLMGGNYAGIAITFTMQELLRMDPVGLLAVAILLFFLKSFHHISNIANVISFFIIY